MTLRTIALATAATLLALPTAWAQPPEDTANIVTLQIENDAVSTLRGTSDQYYTSGLRLGWTSGTNQVPGFLDDAGHAVWGDGVQRVSLDLTQSIFTPRNTQTPNPSRQDRPYAAILGRHRVADP
ncbi:MAG: lipid A-modifier LpxR family protein [Acetobacteraceae bacterium]